MFPSCHREPKRPNLLPVGRVQILPAGRPEGLGDRPALINNDTDQGRRNSRRGRQHTACGRVGKRCRWEITVSAVRHGNWLRSIHTSRDLAEAVRRAGRAIPGAREPRVGRRSRERGVRLIIESHPPASTGVEWTAPAGEGADCRWAINVGALGWAAHRDPRGRAPDGVRNRSRTSPTARSTLSGTPRAVRSPLSAVLVAAAARSGCDRPHVREPLSPGRTIGSSRTSASGASERPARHGVAPLDGVGNAESTPAPTSRATSPQGALRSYALLHINWRASGLTASERTLAAMSARAARLADQQTIASRSAG